LKKKFQQGITNLSARREIEIEKHAVLIEKCKRTDVASDESLLSAAEHAEIKAMNDIDDCLRIAILKLDKLVMIMNDY